jgi:hypothetical protein
MMVAAIIEAHSHDPKESLKRSFRVQVWSFAASAGIATGFMGPSLMPYARCSSV